MPKEDEHIIDYILRVTNDSATKSFKSNKKRSFTFEKKKIKIDNSIFFCEKCKHTWSIVPGWVDRAKWRKYPEGNIPTFKKKRKDCLRCQ
jgi:hypothetical protein